MSQPPVPPSLPPGAGLRTSRPRRGLVKETPPGRVSSVQHLLYLRKPSGPEGALPTLLPWATHSFGERAQIKWRVSQNTGEGHGAALQRGCPAKTESPRKLSSHSLEVGPGLRCRPPCLPPTTPSSALAPQVLPWPHLPAPGMELSAIPDGRAGLGSPHPSESQHGSSARHTCPLFWAKLWSRDC